MPSLEHQNLNPVENNNEKPTTIERGKTVESINELREKISQQIIEQESLLLNEDKKIETINLSVKLSEEKVEEERRAINLDTEIKNINNEAKELVIETQEKLFEKSGISFVFENNPELAKIGTPEQYSKYLDTVFPESKITQNGKSVIMYHNTQNSFNINDFDSKRTMYFTSSLEGHFQPNKNTITALLNIKNPIYMDAYDITNKTEKEKVSKYITENKDGLIANNDVYKERILESSKNPEDYKQDLLFPEVVVFEPDQIYILGSEEDIEGFKEFISRS